MAAAPTLSGTSKRTTSMADTSDAIDTKIAPSASVMAPTPSSQPSDSAGISASGSAGSLGSAGAGETGSADASRSPSGLTGVDQVDALSHTLAGQRISTPLASPSGLPTSQTALRVQETLADSHANANANTSTTKSELHRTTPQNPQHHHLYVGNLSPKVSEEHLRSLFCGYCPVINVKILIHHHPQYPPPHAHAHPLYGTPFGPAGLLAPQMVPGASNYGFVEVADHDAAEGAVQALNGKALFDMPIKVTWAKQQRSPSSAVLAGSTDQHGSSSSSAGLMDESSESANSKQPTFASGLHHVFVGDLSAEVNDAALRNHFASSFASLHEARVMWDMHSGKTRGYGFLAFQDRKDAEEVIRTKNGDWLGGRTIRVNWANQKGSTPAMPTISTAEANTTATADAISSAGAGAGYTSSRLDNAKIGWGSAAKNRSQTVQQQVAMQVGLARGPMNSYNTPIYAFGQQPPASTGPPRPAPVASGAVAGSFSGRKASFNSQTASSHHAMSPPLGSSSFQDVGLPLDYEDVVQQTPPYNTTVYVGNLPHQTGEAELKPLFGSLGLIVEVRMQSDRGYGFVKLDTHENAAQAIVQLHGSEFGGKQLKCSWGKDRQELGPPIPANGHRNGFSHPGVGPHPSAIAAAGMQVPHSGIGMMYGMMPHFGFTGGFYPGVMPMPQVGYPGAHPGSHAGPHHPGMAMQQQMAAMQAAEAHARAAARSHAQQQHSLGFDNAGAGMSPMHAEAQMSPQAGKQQHGDSSQSLQDLSITEAATFYPGPYPSRSPYDS